MRCIRTVPPSSMHPGSPRPWRGSRAVAPSLTQRVVIVCAPPGWGKSTALALAYPSAPRITCRRGEGNARLIAAFAAVLGLSEYEAGALAARSRTEDAAELAGWIIGGLGAAPAVIDDAHELAEDPQSLAVLNALVSSPGFRGAIATRSTSHLPVGTWIAHGFCGLPVAAEDLAFDREDVETFVGPTAAVDLTARSGGWPLGVTLAAPLIARGIDAAEAWFRVTAETRALVAQGLRDQVGSEFPALQIACVRAKAGAASARIHGVPWAHDRPHQSVVESVLSADPPTNDVIERIVTELEHSGDYAAAYHAHRMLAPLRPLDSLSRFGSELFAIGRYEMLRAELDLLHRDARTSSPIAMGFDALLSSLSGDSMRADALLARAINLTDGRLHLHLAATLAQQRLQRYDFAGAATALPTLPALRGFEADEDLLMLHAAHAAHAAATGAIDAEASFDELSDRAVTAKPQVRAFIEVCRCFGAFASERWPDLDAATARLNDLAQAHGLVQKRLSALSFRYTVAVGIRGDFEAARSYAESILHLSSSIHDTRYASSYLAAAYQAEVYSGRWEQAEYIWRKLEALGPGWRGAMSIALPNALVLMRDGKVDLAIDKLVALSIDASQPAGRRARLAAAALFCGLTGRQERGRELLDRLERRSRSRFVVERINDEFADGTAAMAELLCGRESLAKRRIAADGTTFFGKVFVEAARAITASGRRTSAAAVFQRAGLHGFSMLFGADDDGDHGLTPAEIKILAHLAEGLRPDGIATSSGRSIHTIRNQIKMATRKLGSDNALQAVAEARRRGLIGTSSPP